MSSSEQDQRMCPECGTLQRVKTDGALFKHAGTDGETCQQRESADASAEKPVVDEWPEDGAAPDPAADDEDEDDDPNVGPITPPALAPAEPDPEPDPGTYRWTMTIKHPALYLGDAEWHQANADLAAIKAQEAGHTVTGEARWDGGHGGGLDEGTVQLTYLVPVAT